MEKERLEGIIEQAYESVMNQHLRSKDMPEVVKVVSEALRLIDAERGKVAVAWLSKGVALTFVTNIPQRASQWRSNGYEVLPLFLSPTPTIPEGVALVPPEKPLPDLMMASYHEAAGWNACREAMLATAQGEQK